MKTCYLDSNVLAFFGNENSPSHKQATDIIHKLIKQKFQLFFSSLTLDEYFHSVIRFSNEPRALTLKKLKAAYRKLLKLNIKLINPTLDEKKHLKVIDLIGKYNLHPRDAYHLFIMLDNKVEVLATFDRDFDGIFKRGLIKNFMVK